MGAGRGSPPAHHPPKRAAARNKPDSWSAKPDRRLARRHLGRQHHHLAPWSTWARSALPGGCHPGDDGHLRADGTPNVAYLSQVYHVDEQHVALSFQFFNKTRPEHPGQSARPACWCWIRHRAVLPAASALPAHRDHRPVFEAMKAQLAGIASHSGMADRVHAARLGRLRGAADRGGRGRSAAAAAGALRHAGAVRRCSERLARATTMDELLMRCCPPGRRHGVRHAMVLMLDEA
jgi:adenylate cyclase